MLVLKLPPCTENRSLCISARRWLQLSDMGSRCHPPVRVTLRPAVYRQSICLGAKPLGVYDYRIFFRKLNLCGHLKIKSKSRHGRHSVCLGVELHMRLTTRYLVQLDRYGLKSNSCYDRRSIGQSVFVVSGTHLGHMIAFLLPSDSCGFVDVRRPP
jgi:hypothetical protein